MQLGPPPPTSGGNYCIKSFLFSPYPAIPPYYIRTLHPGMTTTKITYKPTAYPCTQGSQGGPKALRGDPKVPKKEPNGDTKRLHTTFGTMRDPRKLGAAITRHTHVIRQAVQPSYVTAEGYTVQELERARNQRGDTHLTSAMPKNGRYSSKHVRDIWPPCGIILKSVWKHWRGKDI